MIPSLKHMTQRARHQQRGAAALVVTLLLLFGSSIVAFYLNRGLIFEQKASANQVRSTAAFEMAEAGIEWATGLLNNPLDVNGKCLTPNAASAQVSFRTTYVQNGATPNATPSTLGGTSFPGCKWNGAAFECHCPAAGSTATATSTATPPTDLGTALQPGFTVTFSAVSKDGTPLGTPTYPVPNLDDEAVLVTATGCTAQAGACLASSTDRDATATVSVILKLKPLLRAAPASALTCGLNCNVGGTGNFDVGNYDAATNGITINAGGAVLNAIGHVSTIPGQPAQNSIIANDPSLAALASSTPGSCTDDKMFSTYFGSTMAAYRASKSTFEITCTNASNCESQLTTAYNNNWRSFYFVPNGSGNVGLELSSATIGSSNDGVTIVTPGAIRFNGASRIYGMVFSNEAVNSNIGTGNSDIFGAMITCENYTSNGNGSVIFDPNALNSARRDTAIFARVPGSWRDFN